MNLPAAGRLRFLLLNILLALVYVGAGTFGLNFASINESASAVWPPTGIALAAMLVFGYRCWPGILLGAFLANKLNTHASAVVCLGISTGNMLESLIGAFLVKQFASGRQAFSNPRAFFLFVFLAGMVSTAVSATFGVTGLALSGGVPALPDSYIPAQLAVSTGPPLTKLLWCADDIWGKLDTPWGKYFEIWFTWWLGDFGGALVVAPFLILWVNDFRIHWRWQRVLEATALQGAVLAVALAVFHGLLPGSEDIARSFLCLPFLALVAFRFGPRETATATLLLAAVAVWGTRRGTGPFGAKETNESLLLLQLFMASTAVTAMALAAAVEDRRRTENDLREARDKLEQRVKERTTELAETNESLLQENKERQLAEDRFRRFLESAPDAMVIADESGTIVFFNTQAESLFGLVRREALGKPIEFLIPERFHAQHRQHRARYFVRPTVRPMGMGLTLMGLRKDGQEFPVEISLSPLTTDQGMLVAAAIRDMTARREVEEKLRQNERLAAIGEMITGMAHESRNALQRSLACLEMLRLEVRDQPRATDLLGRLKESQDHLHHLYEEVREYAAPIVVKKQACSMDEVLGAVWNRVSELQQGKIVRFRQDRDRLNLQCAVDRFAVEQVFRNILENAFAACPDPGEIVALWSDAELGGAPALRVAIRDNGPGLTAEQKVKIFEPFYTTKTRGTGLGMAIATRLVEAHGGRIAVGADQHPGAEILVTFPRGKP